MKLRGYKAKDLSNLKNGPDNCHYETVRDRISKGKHIEITYVTGFKNPEERSVYIPYAESQAIINALNFYNDFLSGKLKIEKVEKKV